MSFRGFILDVRRGFMLRDYLKQNTLVTDGAMGTYYAQLTGSHTTLSELANIETPHIIHDIHSAYIDAGAKLIRTNTFSANTLTLGKSHHEVKTIITRGFEIAQDAGAKEHVFVAADIGPIPEMVNGESIEGDAILNEYIFIVDVFLELGADIFIFETFSSTQYLEDISRYIKSVNKDAFILTQFALNRDGFTRKGISARRIQAQIRKIDAIDAYGYNCVIGPTHLYNIIRYMEFGHDIVSILPNAGYPETINERTVYIQNPKYFADKLMDIEALGIKILGGCCGTTPAHIYEVSKRLGVKRPRLRTVPKADVEEIIHADRVSNEFAKKLSDSEFVIAVELDPPFSIDLNKTIDGARELKQGGVDIITIADSPMAKVRIDPMMMAAKIKREVGIDAMPHLSCRDRNIIALKALLLGGYIEGIRNILIVTGDPIPSSERVDIKSVFNLNSIRFIQMIREMNREIFKNSPYNIGGALNLNVSNKEIEIERMDRKIAQGAKFFLTQPVFKEDTIEYIGKIKEDRDVKILAGVMPIVSYRNALFLDNEVPGMDIPREYIEMFTEDMDRKKAEEIGISIAVDVIDRLRGYADGVYLITPFHRTHMIVTIMERAGLCKDGRR